jgi:hypothetical protein
MDLTPHIDSLRRDLIAAAEVAAPETRAATERLLFALSPAVRLALMDAISQAAAEITSRMPSGSVEVRLNGRELDFVLQLPQAETASPTPPLEEADEDGSLARISLRMPETMKAKAEELAARSGQSLNNWLVNVVRAATRGDLPSGGLADPLPPSEPFGGKRGNRRMTGWIKPTEP